MIFHPDPHFEDEFSTETGGEILIVQYPGPTTGGRPIYDKRFNMETAQVDRRGAHRHLTEPAPAIDHDRYTDDYLRDVLASACASSPWWAPRRTGTGPATSR